MTCCASVTCADQPAKGGAEEARLAVAARDLDAGLRQIDFIVPGMHCAGCLSTIERGLGPLAQVARVRANLSTRTVSVVWDPALGPAAEIACRLEGLGYQFTLRDEADGVEEELAARGRELLIALAVAGFAAANIMLLSVSVWSGADGATAQLFHLISAVIAIPAVGYAGRPFFRSALGALSVGRLNMDVPISLAVLLALGMSIYESLRGGEEAYFDAAVTLLFFLLIGRYLEHLMRQRARGAVSRLASLTARGGLRVGDDGTTAYVPLSEIAAGMRLRVRAGERLPVDGDILAGSADADRSLVTGESAPVLAAPGTRLEAGVMILNGSVDIRAASTADDSFLAEIARMMEAAETGRGTYVRIAERMARIYAPAVHLLALIAFVAWMLMGAGWHAALMTAIAVLIVTCPCALGLAVPVVHVVAAGRLFGAGIMLRDGAALERLAEADRVIFDKTGTLTVGEPLVRAQDGTADTAIIRALAARSAHPAARALGSWLGTGDEAALDRVTEHPGFGVEAVAGGRRVRLGRASWVAGIAARAPDASGSTVCFAAAAADPVVFQLTDRLREEAGEAVDTLRADGLEVEIASGDAPGPVAAVAEALHIDKAASAMTPADKIARVEHLRDAGRKVLMIGDGLNDAPALAAGHVSMAPGHASDIGRLAADLIFIRGDLRAVGLAHRIAVAAGRLVRQNFGLAIVYNCIAVPLAMAGHVTPLIAALAMSGSSIVVILNSLRLGLAPRTTGAVELRAEAQPAPPQAVAAAG